MKLQEFMKLEENRILDERTFGRYVRQRREELGISVRGLAGELGKTPAYISDIEKGNRYAPMKFLDDLQRVLQISDDESLLFRDLASASRGNQYEDINPYLGKSQLARVALRKARDYEIPDSQW